MSVSSSASTRAKILVPALGLVVIAVACSSDPAADPGSSSGTTSSSTSSSASSSGSGSSSGGSSTSSSSGGGPEATDGKKNGTETDIDCGGPDRPACVDGKTCLAGTDCTSGVCNTTCQAPSADDKVKNGDETDVDCGGTSGKTCAAGLTCATHADCESDGCDFQKKCAISRSCTAESGGYTCGEGSINDAGKKHESCCKSIAVPRAAGQGGPFVLDKYLITAGRMRALIERTGGNVRAFTQTIPEGGFIGWKRGWDDHMPASMNDTMFLLGPSGLGPRAGCDMSDSKARTYWMDDTTNTQNLGETGKHPANGQSTLDAKVLNCYPVWLAMALCAWDGGRLPSTDEVLFAWQSDETPKRTFPWGTGANNAQRSSDNEVHNFPEGYPLNWVNVPEPGRYPAGYGKWGHADLVGTVFHFTRNFNAAETQLAVVSSGSWESAHAITAASNNNPIDRAYWAYGARCARQNAN